MSTEMNALKSKLLEIKDQTILIDEEYEAEKLSWQKVREGMGQEIEQLKQDVQVENKIVSNNFYVREFTDFVLIESLSP